LGGWGAACGTGPKSSGSHYESKRHDDEKRTSH
jgi:hypothetical protein